MLWAFKELFLKSINLKRLKSFKNRKTFWSVLAVLGCIIFLFLSFYVFLNLGIFKAQAGSQIYVDGSAGTDAAPPACLNQATPCKTIQYAIDNYVAGSDGDVVNIKGKSGTSQIIYNENIYTTKNVSNTTFRAWVSSEHPKISNVEAPGTDSWTLTNTTGAPSARTQHTVVWTGATGNPNTENRMLVWGGDTKQRSYPLCGMDPAGGKYNQSTNSWEVMATPSAQGRYLHSAVWTGQEMIIRGGWRSYWDNGLWQCGNQPVISSDQILIYDAANNTWTKQTAPYLHSHKAVWAPVLGTRGQMLSWPGPSGGNNVEVYDPATKILSQLSTSGGPASRTKHTAVWTGSTLVIFGGQASNITNTGGIWRPNGIGGCTDTNGCWTTLSTTGAPTGRFDHTAVWTGSKMIVWGGLGCISAPSCSSSEAYLSDGGIWRPNGVEGCGSAGGCWSSLSTAGAPSARAEHTAVWTGYKMIVWGGSTSFGTYTNSGGVYNLNSDLWTSTTTDNTPSSRTKHTAVPGLSSKCISTMIVWGGDTNSGTTNTGGIYYTSAGPVPAFHVYNTANNISSLTLQNIDFSGCCGDAILLEAPGRTISGISITDNDIGENVGDGIVMKASVVGTSSAGINIERNTIHLNGTAILLDASTITQIGIASNEIYSNQSGIVINSGSTIENFTLDNNNYIHDNADYAVSFNAPGNIQNNTFSSNTINANGKGIKLESTSGIVQNNAFSSNTITNTTAGESLMLIGSGDVSSNSLSGNTINKGGITLRSMTAKVISNSITDNNLTNISSGQAININAATYAQSNTIESNTISNTNDSAIYLSSSGNNIQSNKISSNTINTTTIGSGIHIINSASGKYISQNTLSQNNIQNTKESAIFLDAPYIQQNSFSKNTLSSSQNAQGLNLQASSSVFSNLIDSNIIQSNKSHGIYFHPTTTNTLTISLNYITNNLIKSNQDDGINLKADKSSGSGDILINNVILQNLIKQNKGDGIELFIPATASLNSIKTNFIQDNIISNNGLGSTANGINIINSSPSGSFSTNKIFHNTVDSNTSKGIYVSSPSFSQNSLRNNIISNSTSTTGIETNNSTVDSNFNFFYKNNPNVSGYAEGSNSIYLESSSPSPFWDQTNYYLNSLSGSQYPTSTPLAIGAGSGPNKILGDSDDAKVLNENNVGIINMGARKELVINQKTTKDDNQDDFISNSIQKSHDDTHLGGGDVLGTYSIIEGGSSIKSVPSLNAGVLTLNVYDPGKCSTDPLKCGGIIDRDDQHIGNYFLITGPPSNPNLGKVYLIVDTVDFFGFAEFQALIYIRTDSSSGFAANNTFVILDRIYNEDLKKSETPSRQIDLSEKGNPGWPITWQSKTWDKSSAISTDWDWSANPLNVLDAQNSLDHNLYASDDLKCASLRDFNFLNATSTPFGGNSPDNQNCTPLPPEGSTNLSCQEVSWSCIPYTYLELNSKTYDTGVHGGAAYNSILWFGSSPPGLPEYDSNSHAKYLKMQLAASDCPNGYSGPKDDPAVYEENCQDMTQDFWGEPYDPANSQYGSPFYGDDTKDGINCAGSSYYYPDPDEITPIKGECFNKLYNKRYFKYKLILNYYDLDKNGYPSEGDTTCKIDEIIINYSP